MNVVPTLCLAGLLAGNAALAQNRPLSRLLLSALDDQAVTMQQRHSASLGGSYAGLPLVDDLDLRLQNTAFLAREMRYTARLSLRGWGESGAMRDYGRALCHNSAQRTAVLTGQALARRYMLAIDLLEQQALRQLYGDLIAVYQDQIKVMEAQTYSESFDLGDLIDAEKNHTKYRNLRLETEELIGLACAKAASWTGDSAGVRFDTIGLITIDTVATVLGAVSSRPDTGNVRLAYLRTELGLAEGRYRLEKAQGRRYIDFVEFSYDHSDWLDEEARRDKHKDYDLNQAFSVELGLSIPGLTQSRVDSKRREAAYMEAQAEYAELRQELEDQMRKDLADIRARIEQYRFMQARETQVDAVASLKKYLNMSAINPRAVLAIKEGIVKNQIDMAGTKYSILRNYIQVLDVGGQLAQSPLRNWLSNQREVLAP